MWSRGAEVTVTSDTVSAGSFSRPSTDEVTSDGGFRKAGCRKGLSTCIQSVVESVAWTWSGYPVVIPQGSSPFRRSYRQRNVVYYGIISQVITSAEGVPST